MFEAAAHLKGLHLSYDVAPDLPERVWMAPREVINIMTILVGNAVKFTESGTVDMAFWCGHENDVLTLNFSVTDTGPGIPAEAQEKIFSAFTQVDDRPSRSFGGIGLGLTIARRTAQLMGGDITVESTVGQGSRFFFSIPVAAA
jgi:protein-histidine pros-kinase